MCYLHLVYLVSFNLSAGLLSRIILLLITPAVPIVVYFFLLVAKPV